MNTKTNVERTNAKTLSVNKSGRLTKVLVALSKFALRAFLVLVMWTLLRSTARVMVPALSIELVSGIKLPDNPTMMRMVIEVYAPVVFMLLGLFAAYVWLMRSLWSLRLRFDAFMERSFLAVKSDVEAVD